MYSYLLHDQRLDAILRSALYSHFSESLTGLATIRAYGEAERYRLQNQSLMDIENRFVLYRCHIECDLILLFIVLIGLQSLTSDGWEYVWISSDPC